MLLLTPDARVPEVCGASWPRALLTACSLQLKKSGIHNILALRGDPPKGEESFKAVEGGFASALDLVKYIRCRLESMLPAGGLRWQGG